LQQAVSTSHEIFNFVAVKAGDKVKEGEQLCKQGTASYTCMNTHVNTTQIIIIIIIIITRIRRTRRRRR
jgi:hypothetical protein